MAGKLNKNARRFLKLVERAEDPLDALKSAQVIAKATRVAGGC